MIITNDIIESCIYCKTKAYHKTNGVLGLKSDYEIFFAKQALKTRNEFINTIVNSGTNYIKTKNEAYSIEFQNYDFVFNSKFTIDKFQILVDALEKNKIQNAYLYTPIIFLGDEKLSNNNKVYISCISYLLKKNYS